MTTLAENKGRVLEIGAINEFPMVAADKIFEGAAVGVVTASGHTRPLQAGDKFAGFAEESADNSDGEAADINVRVIKRGAVVLPVSGAVITDFDLPVYATDDDTFSFVKTGGVFIGFARRFVEAGVMVVEFDAGVFKDPHEGLTAESIGTSKTLDAEDTAKVFFVTADASTITLPTVAGLKCRVVNAGAFGTIAVTISPNTADGIGGPDLDATDNKDLLLVKATAQRGDYVDIEYGDATGWIVSKMVGTWSIEA